MTNFGNNVLAIRLALIPQSDLQLASWQEEWHLDHQYDNSRTSPYISSSKDLIVIVATQDLGLLKQLKGTLYLMAEGCIVEQATSEEFKENPQQFPRMHQFIEGN